VCWGCYSAPTNQRRAVEGMGATEPPWPSTAFSRTPDGQLEIARLPVATPSPLAVYLSEPHSRRSPLFPFLCFHRHLAPPLTAAVVEPSPVKATASAHSSHSRAPPRPLTPANFARSARAATSFLFSGERSHCAASPWPATLVASQCLPVAPLRSW
jgi:hypothetical protein